MGVLDCKIFKTELKAKAGNTDKQKKAAKKDLKGLKSEWKVIDDQISKMDKKSQGDAIAARESFMKNCRLWIADNLKCDGWGLPN